MIVLVWESCFLHLFSVTEGYNFGKSVVSSLPQHCYLAYILFGCRKNLL